MADSSTMQQLGAYSAEGQAADSVDQVTSVSQLTDVKPTDWAFQALQSLVERYGCIVGYPDRTYRGNRALTRYEFAAGLNACLDKIQELIAAATADFVKKEDLEVVKKLQEEFAAEIATLRGRVDALEVRTATLEKQQFSTTTKLAGEVIFGIADTFGDAATRVGRVNAPILSGGVPVNEDDNTETTFSYRARIGLRTSFTGRDLLFTRLNAGNFTPFSGAFTGTNMTRLNFDANTSSAVQVDKLYYRFPLSAKFRLQIDAINHEVYSGLMSTLSPFESDSLGAVSRFGRFNPILRSGAGASAAGFTFEYKFSDALLLQGGYTGDPSSNDPSSKNGIFNGSNSMFAQVVFRPSRTFDIGLTYVRGFMTASDLTANNPTVTSATGGIYAAKPFNNNTTSSDSFGAQVQFRLNPKITIGGWGALTRAYQGSSSNEATIINWAAFLAFPDLGKRGNLGGLLVGMPPKVTDNDFPAGTTRREDRDTSLHVEAFYRYRVNDNIAITPGFYVLFNPEHNSNNDTQFVGVLRTTFSF
jgi:hypothetical protein